MLIVSKYHDYYDSVVASTGVDKQIVYRREEQQIELPDMFRTLVEAMDEGGYLHRSLLDADKSIVEGQVYQLHPILVGFCGAAHVWYWWEVPKRRDQRQYPWETITGFSNDPGWYRRVDNAMGRGRKHRRREDKKQPTRFDRLIEFVQSQPDWLELFIEVDAPVWMLSKNFRYVWSVGRNWPELWLNPCLRDLDFQRLIDPYTAFQELYQFVGGVLQQPAPATVEVSDQELATAKGFDKWSFRRLPTK